MKRTTVLASAVVTLVLVTGCSRPTEMSALGAVNNDRAAGGLGTLANNGPLVVKAQKWAQELANTSGGRCSMETLRHSDLKDGAPGGWRLLGENVGCRIAPGDEASFVEPLEQAFMASEHHRENIMNGNFNHGGFGIATAPAATGNGWMVVYEAQEFARL
jgi:uncharacterized protein YkwD